MKRLFSSNLCIALGAIVCCSALAAPADALPRKDIEPKIPPTKTTPPPPVDPEIWSGAFNGATALVLRERLPIPKSPKTTTEKTFNIKSALTSAWNLNRNEFQNTVKDFLTKQTSGYKLYNVKVALGFVDDAAPIRMTVDPKRKRLTLSYAIPGNQIDCRANLNNLPDPNIRVKFDLSLIMVLETNGSANSPLVVRSATMSVRNAKATIDGNLLFDALRGLKEFFGGSNFARQVERSFNGQSVNVTAKLASKIEIFNAFLRPYTAGRGYSLVTPRYDRAASRLVLEMAQPALAIRTPLRVR